MIFPANEIKQKINISTDTRYSWDARVYTYHRGSNTSHEAIFWNLGDEISQKEIFETPHGHKETHVVFHQPNENETFEDFVRAATEDKQELIHISQENTEEI